MAGYQHIGHQHLDVKGNLRQNVTNGSSNILDRMSKSMTFYYPKNMDVQQISDVFDTFNVGFNDNLLPVPTASRPESHLASILTIKGFM